MNIATFAHKSRPVYSDTWICFLMTMNSCNFSFPSQKSLKLFSASTLHSSTDLKCFFQDLPLSWKTGDIDSLARVSGGLGGRKKKRTGGNLLASFPR